MGVVVGLVPAVAGAVEAPADRPPLVVAFPCSVGEQSVPADSEVVAAVIEHLRRVGSVEVLAFNPDLPAVTRAIMERRLEQDILSKILDVQTAARVAGILGAQYALGIQGSVIGDKVSVALELLKVPGGGSWASGAESMIAEGRGSRAAVNRANAVSTAASSAVSQIVILAFGQSALLEPPAPPAEPSVPLPTAPASPEEPEAARDTSAEYIARIRQVDAYVAKHDLPNAVVELRRVINLEPDNAAPRVRLAQIYSDLGMAAEAVEECKRALLFRPDSASVYNMLANLYLANGAPADAAEQCREAVRLDPENTDALLTLGDICWNQNNVAEAEQAFEEAAKSAPLNPLPRERLHRFYAARRMHGPAIEQLLQARLLAAGGEPDDSAQYRIASGVIRDEFDAVADKLKADREDYEAKRLVREDYCRECKDAAKRVEASVDLLSGRTPPALYKDAHSHGVLALSLLAQAAGYMVSHLETGKQYYAEQAAILQMEAKTEMDLFSDAVLRTQPPAAPA